MGSRCGLTRGKCLVSRGRRRRLNPCWTEPSGVYGATKGARQVWSPGFAVIRAFVGGSEHGFSGYWRELSRFRASGRAENGAATKRFP